MGEIGVAILVILVVLCGILFSIAVGQGTTISKYERQLMEQAKKGNKK